MTALFLTILLAAQTPAPSAVQAMNALLAGDEVPHVEAKAFGEARRRYECVTSHGVRVSGVSESGDRAEVALIVGADAELPITRARREFPPYWIVQLHRAGDDWIADRVESPEKQLTAELDRLPGAEARAAAIDAHPAISPAELSIRISDLLDATYEHYEHRIELAELAISLASEAASADAMARALLEHGDAYEGLHRHTLARAGYESALALVHDENRELAGKLLASIADNESVIGKAEPSIGFARRALAIARELHNDRIAAKALLTIGNDSFLLGNYRDALRGFVEGAESAHRAGDLFLEAGTTANAGLVHFLLNNDALAIDYLQRAVPLYRSIGHLRGENANLGNLAEIEIHQERLSLAAKHLRELEHNMEQAPNARTRGNVEIHWADLLIRRRRFDDAIPHIARALQLSKEAEDPSIATWALNFRARARVGQKRYADALADAREAARMSLVVAPNTDAYWAAHFHAGRAYARLGQFDRAKEELRESIATIEGYVLPGGDEDSQLFFQDKLEPYYELFAVLLRDDPAAALDVVEQARARTLLRIVSQPRAVTDRTLTDAERQQEKATDDELTALNVAMRKERLQAAPDAAKIERAQQQIAQKRLARAERMQSLYARHPELSVARGDIPRPPIGEIRKSIPDDGAVLEYVAASDAAWLIVVTRNDPPQVIRLHAHGRALAAMTESFAAQIAQQDLTLRPAAKKLYALLVAPAAPLIRGKRILCIVPDGPLWNVPFQALIGNDGRPLVERKDIFYAPSLSVLAWYAAHPRRSPAKFELLAFGNPRLGGRALEAARLRGAQLAPLPEAEDEVKALAAIYGPEATQLRVGSAATETRLKEEAGDFRILHLATHAVFDDTDPMYSYLVLARAPDDANDGLLEAREIEQMSLHADLAVLSACNTGRGRVRGGEGITGMSWALLAAGCPTAVVSRFAVGSASTRDLMIAFHKRLAASKQPSPRAATRALADAQRALLRDEQHAHPFHWAAFMLFGRGW